MAFTNIWHKLHLHRQKIAIAALFVFALLQAPQAEAQKKIKAENKPGYDDKRVHYGFYLGIPFTRYNVEHSQAYADQLASGGNIAVNAKTRPGFYPGLVLNVRLFEYLDARFLPGVGFYGRSINFENMPAVDDKPIFDDATVSTTMIELPLLLKYKAKRRGNFRMYFVGGVKPGIDLGSRKDTDTGEKIQTEKRDLALEYGVGLDIFYPYFKFAPELRFSHGLLNQKANFSSAHSDLIERMTNHNVSLILFFE